MGLIHILNDSTSSSITDINDKAIQPNAVDIKCDKMMEIYSSSDFIIDEERKIHREVRELIPNKEGYYELLGGHSYEFSSSSIIKVGEEEAAMLVIRSTLNRNGVYLTAGLYDSGFEGNIAGVLHVSPHIKGKTYIKRGTRIAQLLLFDAESLFSYDGDYGLNKENNTKYHIAR